MEQKRETRPRCCAGRASKQIPLARICGEDSTSPLHLQLARLLDRVKISPELAAAMAEHAYPRRAA